MGETMRDAFGKRLAALGGEMPGLVVLDADVSSSTKSSYFAKAYPDRFFNVGVAEANMVDVAAGLATAGYRPVVNAFAIFLALKGTDQIRNVLAYNSLPVVLAGAYGGLSDSYDGASHQSITDIAIMRAIPGVRVLVPGDAADAARALDYALACDGPVYIRLSRNDNPGLPARDPAVGVEAARTLRAGSDLTIAASGLCVSMALEAAEQLSARGVSAEVLDFASVKPLDAAALVDSVARTGRLVTAEEHSVIGGLAGACAEALAVEGIPYRLGRVGVADCFTESGPYDVILRQYGISASDIVACAGSLL
ncbi:MAG: 1-deoxy-D-xylulose-5-phosphate synthase [Spirochaetes bacterium]|nr:1-deoxy-D-xylulose-5-phosphate synthase [Spirochaetota bacterium]